MNLPPLSALKTFEAAARHLSFSKAGDELFVTHAAVSHQIRNLEEWFGSQLFTRRGRGVQLSRSGDMLFRQISPALYEIAEACTRVKALQGKETLIVGCIPSIATRWLIPNLSEFTSSHPGVDVTVVYATADQSLSKGNLDVLITIGEEGEEGVVSKRVFSWITKPVCSPAFFDANGPFDSPEMISKAPLLHDEFRNGWAKWFRAAQCDWPSTDSWPVYQDFNLLATAMIAGHGIALCPTEVFRQEIERGDLIVVSNISVTLGTAYYASCRQSADKTAFEFIEWFVGFVGAT